MANLLSGFTAIFQGLPRLVFQWPTILGAKTQTESLEILKSDGNGGLVTADIPFGADQQVVAYYGATNNVQTVTYKKAGVTLKTRTFTYAGGGAANDDTLIGTVDA